MHPVKWGRTQAPPHECRHRLQPACPTRLSDACRHRLPLGNQNRKRHRHHGDNDDNDDADNDGDAGCSRLVDDLDAHAAASDLAFMKRSGPPPAPAKHRHRQTQTQTQTQTHTQTHRYKRQRTLTPEPDAIPASHVRPVPIPVAVPATAAAASTQVPCPVCQTRTLSLSAGTLWCTCGALRLDVGLAVCMETVRARLAAVVNAHATRCRAALRFALRDRFGTFLWASCDACHLDLIAL